MFKYFVSLQISGNVRELNQAWDLYYHVFRRVTRQLPQLTSLELQYVSPNLQVCQDLELAVPGSYAPGQPIVRIASFHESLEVSSILKYFSVWAPFWGTWDFVIYQLIISAGANG